MVSSTNNSGPQKKIIKFGTSGWRGIIADDFNFHNLRVVTQAIANYLKSKTKNSIVVGYDTRFLSEKFAQESAKVLVANNFKIFFSQRDIPTPVISYEIITRKASGGINITASHNPPEYNGLKFSPSWGGPALPEDTKKIEENCLKLQKEGKILQLLSIKKSNLFQFFDGRVKFLKRLNELVNKDKIKNLKIGVDLLYGTGRGYLDNFLKSSGCKIFVIHNWRDVLFNNSSPEPSEKNLTELKNLVLKNKLDLGLSVDGDADRFGILDFDGSFFTPNEIIAMLLWYLVKTRKWKGVVARSVMTTHFIDAIAKKLKIPVRETPVGFKYIGEIMIKEDFIIGGEESGGLTIKNHIPEKDGILASLLVAEMVAEEKKSLKEIKNFLFSNFGEFYSKRINLKFSGEQFSKLPEKLNKITTNQIKGLAIKNINRMDGTKLILEDDSWIGFRTSGTEPVVRIYLETRNLKKLLELEKKSKRILNTLMQ